jgi:hypothetical protein
MVWQLVLVTMIISLWVPYKHEMFISIALTNNTAIVSIHFTVTQLYQACHQIQWL